MNSMFQILEILHIPDKQVAKQFLRVACSTIAIMWSQYPDLTKQYVLQPLMGPLLKCIENTGKYGLYFVGRHLLKPVSHQSYNRLALQSNAGVKPCSRSQTKLNTSS